MALTKVDDRGLTTPIDLQDNEKIRLGTGNDVEIYFNGNQGVINSTTNNLLLFSDTAIQISSTAGSKYFKGQSGAAELYHSDTLRLATSSSGNTLHGAQQNLNGDVKFDNQTNAGMDLRWDESLNRLHFEQDNMKAVFGTGSDLEIYHDGTVSHIHDDTSSVLQLTNNDIRLKTSGDETMIRCIANDTVKLMYNGSTKIETTNTGATVTGTLIADGLTLGSDELINLGDNNNLRLFFESSTGKTVIQNHYTTLEIRDTSGGGTGVVGAKFVNAAQVELNHNGSKKLETTSTGIKVTGVTAGAQPSLVDYYDDIIINNSASSSGAAGSCGITMVSGNGAWGSYNFADTDNNQTGYLKYSHSSDQIHIGANAGDQVHINTNGTYPSSDNAKSLGSSSKKWSQVHATTYYGDGSNLTGMFVTGMIMLWSGAANAIPTGWVLCNGSNSTPDLRGKFIVGYSDTDGDYDVGDTGGAASVTLTTDQIPSHTHNLLFGIGSFGGSSGAQTPRDSGTTSNRISSTGGGQAHENRPPYYALCYIMKT